MRLIFTCLLAFTTLCPALAQSENLSLSLLGGEEQSVFLDSSDGSSADTRNEALSEAAKSLLAELYQSPPNRTASIMYDLERLLDSRTRSNELDEAVALRDILRGLSAIQKGIQPDPGTLSTFRGQNGKQFAFFVTGRKQGTVWGSGVYTDDSALSSVAVHTGLLAEGESGTVRVMIRPGQEQYTGSERNKVASQPYGSFAGSYTVTAGAKTNTKSAPKAKSEPKNFLPKEAQEILMNLEQHENQKTFQAHLRRGVRRLLEMQRTYARAARLDEAVAIKDAAFELLVLLYNAIPAPNGFTEERNCVGQSAYFVVKGRTAGSVWGNGTYTDDSTPGAAAVHAGLLRPGQKGIVKVMLLPGLDAYEGFSRNGVTSNSYETWQGSYQLEAIPDK